jgi:hypothetical protein
MHFRRNKKNYFRRNKKMYFRRNKKNKMYFRRNKKKHSVEREITALNCLKMQPKNNTTISS